MMKNEISDRSQQIAVYPKTESDLAVLRKDLKDVVFDCTTAKGLKEAKSSRMLFVKLRTGLEKLRVEIKAEALERCQTIDSEARRITAEITELEEPISAQIKIQEDLVKEAKAKKLREEAEAAQVWKTRIERIKARPLDFITSEPGVILEAIIKARKVSVDGWPEDLVDEAGEALVGAIRQMEAMHIKALDDAGLRERLAELEANQPEPETENPKTEPVTDADEPFAAGQYRPVPGSVAIQTEDPGDVAQIIESVMPAKENVLQEFIAESLEIDHLIIAAKAVVAHYGEFRKPHETIVALGEAIKSIESV